MGAIPLDVTELHRMGLVWFQSQMISRMLSLLTLLSQRTLLASAFAVPSFALLRTGALADTHH